jgi:hypothetical protein
LLNPQSLSLIFFSIEILLILLFDDLTGIFIFVIECANPLDGGVDILDELHLELEEARLFDLLMHEVDFFMQELYFLGKMHGTIAVHPI